MSSPGPLTVATGAIARRAFQAGTDLFYSCDAINAKTGAGHRLGLTFEARLFHDGEQVVTGEKALPANSLAEQPRVTGRIALSRDLRRAHMRCK